MKRIEMIKYIKSNLCMISDDDMKEINNIFDAEEKQKRLYDMLLLVINDILEYIGKEKIQFIEKRERHHNLCLQQD